MPEGLSDLPFDLQVAYAQYSFATTQQEYHREQEARSRQQRNIVLQKIKAARNAHVEALLVANGLEVCEFSSSVSGTHGRFREDFDPKDPRTYGLLPKDEVTRLLYRQGRIAGRLNPEHLMDLPMAGHSVIGTEPDQSYYLTVCERHMTDPLKEMLTDTPDPETQSRLFIERIKRGHTTLIEVPDFPKISRTAEMVMGRVAPRTFSPNVHRYFNSPPMPSH